MSDSYHEIWNETQTNGGFTIKKFTPNGYPKSSVLSGQCMIQFVTSFDTLEEAQAAYPDAEIGGPFTSVQNSFDHLPDEEGGW